MRPPQSVEVDLLPSLVPGEKLAHCVAVVVDVLRATTTMIHALAAGCRQIRPVAEVEEAVHIAGEMRVGRVILGGERDGKPLPGFDLGNSPKEYTPAVCKDTILVMTTSNGTRALLQAAPAPRILIGAFVNFSALCEQLRQETRPVRIICAGSQGEITLEDTLLAGAIVDYLCDVWEVQLNDSARLAWDSYETQGCLLREALELSRGGTLLRQLGYDEDIRAAADIDRFNIVPELRRDPLRVEVGSVGIAGQHWGR